MHTQVGIVGAGPAGLLLSHLLHLQGITSIIVERRSRDAIEQTIRAGVLEQGTIDLMTETGLGERLHREGFRHEGFDFLFDGARHRIDMQRLVGRCIMVYPQHEVLKDLIAARLAAGADIRFAAADTQVHAIDTDQPRITFTDAQGQAQEITCDFLAGCDGSYGVCRKAIPDSKHYLRIYPFGWFGILAEAPPSIEELIYARSSHGFALISTRSETVQRMYFQCDPAENAETWSDAQIWDTLQARVASPGFSLKEGPIFQKGVIPLRSFVCEPMRHGRLFLAGDAAHAVPPTGAKGLNLAANDVVILARAIERFYKSANPEGLESYSRDALRRVWRAQHFSWWMTSMLHNFADANDFDERRQRAELELVTGDDRAAASLASIYAGAPLGS